MLKTGPSLETFQNASAVPKLLRGAITYAAGTTGAIGATTLFTVTGDVAITYLQAKCTTDLTSAGAPTWTIGVTGNTSLAGQTFPDVTGWDAGEWVDAINTGYVAGGSTTGINEGALGGNFWVASANIIQTIAVATITAGVVRWYLQYIPLSGDGAVALHANLVAF